MPFEAQFLHGDPLMVDHTPSGAVAAGEVVVVGNTPRVAHLDIAANTLGALAAGGGVYQMLCASGANVAAGKLVYWDNAANAFTETASGNLHFGFTVAAVTKATYGPVKHDPNGEPAA